MCFEVVWFCYSVVCGVGGLLWLLGLGFCSNVCFCGLVVFICWMGSCGGWVVGVRCLVDLW